MGHIFVSYARKDKDGALQKVLHALVDGGFKSEDIWYDQRLEPDARWIPQIDRALEDASVMIVVVTPAAMESWYVTYEWSWALGNGLPLIALLLEGEHKIMHPRLAAEHTPPCHDGIPTEIIELLKDKITNYRDIRYLNQLIMLETMRLQVITTVALWFFDHFKGGDEWVLFCELMESMLDEVRLLYSEKLPRFIVTYSSAFTSKQKRLVRNLANDLFQFRNILVVPVNKSYTINRAYDAVVPEARAFWNTMLPKLECFYIEHHYEEAYQNLCAALNALSAGNTSYLGSFVGHKAVVEWTFSENTKVQQKILQAISIVEERVSNSSSNIP